ncbi:hypothetical protein HYX58_04590 [Candidatus Dependentiae bacterium]|nr:hypothetical protein [Candidatus Dependentiae bacterium]
MLTILCWGLLFFGNCFLSTAQMTPLFKQLKPEDFAHYVLKNSPTGVRQEIWRHMIQDFRKERDYIPLVKKKKGTIVDTKEYEVGGMLREIGGTQVKEQYSFHVAPFYLFSNNFEVSKNEDDRTITVRSKESEKKWEPIIPKNEYYIHTGSLSRDSIYVPLERFSGIFSTASQYDERCKKNFSFYAPRPENSYDKLNIDSHQINDANPAPGSCIFISPRKSKSICIVDVPSGKIYNSGLELIDGNNMEFVPSTGKMLIMEPTNIFETTIGRKVKLPERILDYSTGDILGFNNEIDAKAVGSLQRYMKTISLFYEKLHHHTDPEIYFMAFGHKEMIVGLINRAREIVKNKNLHFDREQFYKYSTCASDDKDVQVVTSNDLGEKEIEAKRILEDFRRIEPEIVRTQILYFDSLYPLEKPIELKGALSKTHTNSFEILYQAVARMNKTKEKKSSIKSDVIQVRPELFNHMVPIQTVFPNSEVKRVMLCTVEQQKYRESIKDRFFWGIKAGLIIGAVCAYYYPDRAINYAQKAAQGIGYCYNKVRAIIG